MLIFFVTPQETARMQLDGPVSVIRAFEQAAAHAQRTWNAQFTYVLSLCLGYHPPAFDDGRSVEDWFTLLSPCRFRFTEAEDSSPCTCLRWQPFRKTGAA